MSGDTPDCIPYPSAVTRQGGDCGVFKEALSIFPPGDLHPDSFIDCRAGRPHSVATRGVGTPPDVMRRGLLPFPLSATSAGTGESSVGCHTRTQKRRFRRSSEARGLLSDLCGSLNELGGFGRDGGPDAVNEVQSAALGRLQHDCKETAEITRGVVPLESFRDLKASRGGYGSSEGISCGNSVMYQKGALKLPVGGAGRHDLIDFLPEPWSTSMIDGTGILLNVGSVPSTPFTDIGCVVDPVLRRKGYDYGHFIGCLSDAAVIEPCTEADFDSICGTFVVSRKDGLQRLIFDPRRSNQLCNKPPKTLYSVTASSADLRTTG